MGQRGCSPLVQFPTPKGRTGSQRVMRRPVSGTALVESCSGRPYQENLSLSLKIRRRTRRHSSSRATFSGTDKVMDMNNLVPAIIRRSYRSWKHDAHIIPKACALWGVRDRPLQMDPTGDTVRTTVSVRLSGKDSGETLLCQKGCDGSVNFEGRTKTGSTTFFRGALAMLSSSLTRSHTHSKDT